MKPLARAYFNAEGVLIYAEAFADLTPKAFANFSPGLERSDNPGYTNKNGPNPERVSLDIDRVTLH